MTVLHVTSSWDTTTDLVIRELDRRGIVSVRLNTEAFPTRAQMSLSYDEVHGCTSTFTTDSGRIARLSEIESIYYRRPEPSSFENYPAMREDSRVFCTRESFAALTGYLCMVDCLWVNNPFITRRAEVKAEQLRIARECGFLIPRTLISNDVDTVRSFVDCTATKVLVKTIHSPRISTSGTRLAFSHLLSKSEIGSLDALKLAPCIFQEYVPKDVEYRVTVVGQEIFPVVIYSQECPASRIDWRKADYKRLRHELSRLPDIVAERCLKYTRRQDLLFAAIDIIRRPDGEYVFIECNPNGEWGWIEATTGAPVARAIANLLTR